jgi:hypothetical protein
MHKLEPGVRLNLFTLMPSGDLWTHAFFWVFLAAAVLLTVGLATRLSSVLVFLCLTSMHQRNLYLLHSGDGFMRVAGFFLIFAPAGAAFSLDRWIRIRRKGQVEIELCRPWAQRMIQFNMALFYLTACWWKSLGADWVNGSAVYYVIHLDQLLRFPLPASFGSPFFVKLATWLTLALEFSLSVLVWFRETRYPVLLVGVLFHLSLEYALNVPLFEWDLLSAYVLFIDPADLTRAWIWIRSRAPLKTRVLIK